MGLVDFEIFERAFGLGAPVSVRGNLDFAKSVTFCSGRLAGNQQTSIESQ